MIGRFHFEGLIRGCGPFRVPRMVIHSCFRGLLSVQKNCRDPRDIETPFKPPPIHPPSGHQLQLLVTDLPYSYIRGSEKRLQGLGDDVFPTLGICLSSMCPHHPKSNCRKCRNVEAGGRDLLSSSLQLSTAIGRVRYCSSQLDMVDGAALSWTAGRGAR